MKILKYLSIPIFALMLSSCEDREDAVYDGDNFVSFAAKTSEATVVKGSTSKEVTVSYTTLSEAKANTEVKISVDASNSTAVEGTDFKIINATDNLAAGQKVGNFRIQLLESGAKETPKVITFKISSPSVSGAIFNQTHALTYSLECPYNISIFSGTYKVVTDTWEDYPVGAQITVQQGPGANQFKILANANPYISNGSTAYMIVTVANNGNVVVTSNEPFNYGGANVFAVTGTGTVNFCTGGINISSLAFGSNSGYKFVLQKN